MLQLEGCRNFRDLGGYPVDAGGATRGRRLYRADALGRLSAADRAVLVKLGVRTVIDLRDETELQRSPSVFPTDGIEYRWIPLLPPPVEELDIFAPRDEIMLCIVNERGAYLRDAIQALAEPGTLPAVFNCSEGKDRTGLLAAIVLAAVGVSRKAIADDYALSTRCLGESYLEEKRAFAAARGWDWDMHRHLWECPPALIERVLTEVDRRYGSVPAYLKHIGLVHDELARLRESLTVVGAG